MKMVIGITGGISSGKSTVSNYIKSLGYKVIDADLISREIMKPKEDGFKAVLKEFPSCFDGEVLLRDKLGSLIFNDEKKREKLNSITHPIIKDRIELEISKSDGLIFLDVPLLFEAHFDTLCDYTILVYIDKLEQIKRLMLRDNITYDYAVSKIDSQMSLDDKKELADYIIYNDSTLNDLYKSVDKVIEGIKNGKNLSNK